MRDESLSAHRRVPAYAETAMYMYCTFDLSLPFFGSEKTILAMRGRLAAEGCRFEVVSERVYVLWPMSRIMTT